MKIDSIKQGIERSFDLGTNGNSLLSIRQQEGVSAVKRTWQRFLNGFVHYCCRSLFSFGRAKITIKSDGSQSRIFEWGDLIGRARIEFEGGEKFLVIGGIEAPPTLTESGSVRRIAEAVLALLREQGDLPGAQVDPRTAITLCASGHFSPAKEAKISFSARGEAAKRLRELIKLIEEELGGIRAELAVEKAKVFTALTRQIQALRQELNEKGVAAKAGTVGRFFGQQGDGVSLPLHAVLKPTVALGNGAIRDAGVAFLEAAVVEEYGEAGPHIQVVPDQGLIHFLDTDHLETDDGFVLA